MAGVIITAIAAAFTLVATKFAYGALRAGRESVGLARNAGREHRAALRFERLQRLPVALTNLQNAAAAAQVPPSDINRLRDARAALKDLLRPFSGADLPAAFRAFQLSDAGPQGILDACEDAQKEIADELHQVGEELARLAAQ